MAGSIRAVLPEAKELNATHLVLANMWAKDLISAVSAAHSEGCPSDSVTREELAWTIAWLLKECACKDSPMAKSLEHLRDAAVCEDWDRLHKIFTRRLGLSRHRPRKTMPMQELSWSAGCERRLDWRPPPAATPAPSEKENGQAVDWASARADASNRTFAKLLELEGDVVRAGCRRWGREDPDGLADRAWSAAYTTYWSAQARRRWAGNARVSTLILGVAKKLWLSEQAERQPTWMIREPDDLRYTEHNADESGPLDSIVRDVELVATPKQQEVLRLLVERGLSQQQAARVLDVSEAAVCQLLSRLAARLEPLGYSSKAGRRGRI